MRSGHQEGFPESCGTSGLRGWKREPALRLEVLLSTCLQKGRGAVSECSQNAGRDSLYAT